MRKADLILHPVRIRIMMALVGQQMTAGDLAKALPDIAQATLYRHINALADAEILQVVAENQVRGTVEKVYTLAAQGGNLTPADLAEFSKDDHLRLFTTFMTSVLESFARYLEHHESPDFAQDGVGYRQVPLHLTDEELVTLTQALNGAIQPYLAHEPDETRKRRIFTTILIPDESDR